MIKVHGSLLCPPFSFFYILFYPVLFDACHQSKVQSSDHRMWNKSFKVKIYGMSKTQEYFLGCYAMFSDKFDVHGTVHR
jgi:hypothetical protein